MKANGVHGIDERIEKRVLQGVRILVNPLLNKCANNLLSRSLR